MIVVWIGGAVVLFVFSVLIYLLIVVVVDNLGNSSLCPSPSHRGYSLRCSEKQWVSESSCFGWIALRNSIHLGKISMRMRVMKKRRRNYPSSEEAGAYQGKWIGEVQSFSK